MEPVQAKMVVRAPSLKRGRSEDTDRFQLEHVMGVTVNSNSALACDPNSHLVAYPSGCTVVLYNTSTGVQQSHIVNICRKTITTVAFSSDGRYLATGECGHMPSVRIWDLQDAPNGTGGVQVAEFQGHQYGINCVAFSPSNKYVVSIGSQHDMIVNVWEWKNNLKIASNKVSTKVKGVCFAQDGSYFVTVGNRHVKYWYLEYTRNTKYKEAVPLVGRAGILGTQRAQNFVAVVCGLGECAESTYVVTKSGLLCQLNNRRLLDKWLELRTTSASSMTIGEKYIFVGCAEGIVRCFDPISLSFVTTLPRTHHLGVDVSLGTSISHMSTYPPNAKYPDTVAVTYDETNHKLTSIYNDHSIYVWDVRDVRRVGKSQSFLYHSACIWGIEMFPTKEEIAQYRNPSKDVLPEGCFVTCSSDDTIRIWNLDANHALGNIYSNELIKIIYMDPDLNYIKDQDLTLSGSNDKVDISYDGKNGVRCLRLRPDAIHLAAGDRAGNITIHDIRSMKEIYRIEAHDAEVLCLEYSKNGRLGDDNSGYPRLLASASRDRLIHVFNVDDHYKILQTLDDHSSSITSVKFITIADQLKMISCGADKSIIFRSLTINNDQEPFLLFQRDHNVAGRTTLYDMEIDINGRNILTACQDRTVRFYSTRSGHYVRSFRGSPAEDGSLIKVTLNSTGRYMATSCSDKTLAVYCTWSGTLLACVCGHSELATGLKFTKNGDRLVSAGGDASVLLWKHTKQKKPLVIPSGSDFDGVDTPASPTEIFDPNANLDHLPDYRFTPGPLPLWAKKQIPEETDVPTRLTTRVDLPKGRWAQRIEQSGISVRSVFDNDSIIPFPEPQDIKQDSDGSKDSSVDSGTESRNYSEYRREPVSKFKQEEQISEEFVACSESMAYLASPSQSYTSQHSLILNRSNITVRHPHTDDSSLGSMLGGSSAVGGDTCEDSTAEHDGDVEDCSDNDHSKLKSHMMNLQYPDPGAHDSPSEYTVNAITVEELRKSQRRSKKRDLPLISLSTNSVSGSQESDFDDDDASTPSGDNNDKNSISMFSGSTESIDTLASRGKYLQTAFDSLSGGEQLHAGNNKNTLSALHHNTRTTNVPERNIPLVNETKQTKYENDNLSKREELNRRIEQTRMQLQSVGYKSNLKSSQSVLDLSPIPEKQKSPSQKNVLLGVGSNINLHAIGTNDTNKINKNDFNIPANINIKNNFKTLPYFSDVNPNYNIKDHSLYNLLINKFNQDMRDLVLQTENTESFTRKPIEKPQNYVTEIAKKIEKNIQSQNRPNMLNLGCKKHKSLPVSPVTEETKLSDYVKVASNVDLSKKIYKKNRFRDEEEENFSSDSLEDGGNDNRIKKYTKATLPRSSSTLLKRVVTYSNESLNNQDCNLNELSHSKESILSEKSESIEPYNIYPEYERHSSASFYLRNVPPSVSQESILSNFSDDLSWKLNEEYSLSRTNCNSLESVLSDESIDTQSAPLEVLFRNHRRRKISETESTPLEQNYVQRTLMKFEPNINRNTGNIPSMQTKNDQYEKQGFGKKIIAKSKSCSFEVFFDMKNNKNTKSLERATTSHENKHPGYTTQSLDRSSSQVFNETKRDGFELLLGDIVKHKPPKGMRRSASAKVKVKTKMDERRNSDTQIRKQNYESAFEVKSVNLHYYEPSNKIGICEQVPRDEELDSENGLRRACSLSDLTDPNPSKDKTSIPPAKMQNKPIPRAQQQLRYSSHSSKTNMMRCSSVGGLNNHSESESEIVGGSMQPPKAMPRSSLMRPTISSQNKVASVNKTSLRRRVIQSSYSTANLTMVGQDDSSSDDQQQIKKAARNRSHSIDQTAGWNTIQRRNKENIGPKTRSNRSLSDRTNTDRTDSDVDFANSELTTQLCTKIAEQLTRTADNVVQLYRRLAVNNESLSPNDLSSHTVNESLDKSHMMKNLECAMFETQKILQLAIKQEQQQDGGAKVESGVDATTDAMLSHNNLRDLVASASNSNQNQANVVVMMQQYSDILLNMMQQKMYQKQS